MAWTSPRTWTAGEFLTAALLNTHLRDQLAHLAAKIGTTASGVASRTAAHTLLAGTTVGSTNGAGELTVAFGVTFAAAPAVTVCSGDSSIAAASDMAVKTTSTTGFVADCGVLSGTVRVNWVAVGQV